MKLVVLGLSLSSSWGNGHATTYRALLRAFAQRGHEVLFLERQVPWYAGERRDLADPAFCRLAFYGDLAELKAEWRDDVAGAGACLITDAWEGVELFLQPGAEVLVARDGQDVADLLASLTEARAREIGRAALARVLAEHTYARRGAEADALFRQALARKRERSVA